MEDFDEQDVPPMSYLPTPNLSREGSETQINHDEDLNPSKIALMSDIFDCIVGCESSESEAYDPLNNSLKHHIRQLAIKKRKEIARNILKTESGKQVVDAIKTRIAHYRVSHCAFKFCYKLRTENLEFHVT